MKNDAVRTMNEDSRKALASLIATSAVAALIASTKATNDSDSGTFSVVCSTADRDRQNEIVKQDGWDLAFYKLNPVVLWAHDYSSLPIGTATSIGVENGKLVAKGKFAPASANPFAQQIRMLYDLGIIKTVSVGFIPREFDQNDRDIVTKAELLEFSFVPVPANAYALSQNQVKDLGIDMDILRVKGLTLELVDEKGVVPYADHGKEDEGAAWDAGKERKEAGDDFKKLKAMCAWFDSSAADKKGSYKLPHHEAAGLKANWHGTKAAMGAIMGARGGVSIPDSDKRGVYNHLKKHYAQFEKEAPDYEKAMAVSAAYTAGMFETAQKMAVDLKFDVDLKAPQVGDPCQMDDGSAGTMGMQGGKMVCLPSEEKSIQGLKDKVKDAMDGLDKSIEVFKAAHEKAHADHQDRHEKAVEVFKDAIHKCMKDWADGDPTNPNKSVKGVEIFKDAFEAHSKAVEDENGRHKAEMEDHHEPIHKAIEIYKDAVEDCLKAYPSSDETGDDAGANPTADQVRMVKAVKEAVGHLKNAYAALKEHAGSEGEGHPLDSDTKAAEKGRDPHDGPSLDKYIRDKEVLRAIDQAVGNTLRKLNSAKVPAAA